MSINTRADKIMDIEPILRFLKEAKQETKDKGIQQLNKEHKIPENTLSNVGS